MIDKGCFRNCKKAGGRNLNRSNFRRLRNRCRSENVTINNYQVDIGTLIPIFKYIPFRIGLL